METGLTWTTTPPTVPGWYWWRMFNSNHGPATRPIVGLVGMDNMFHCHKYRKRMDEMPKGQWAGPLEVPKEG